ncbi:hypothetical protein BDA99DRAFT_130523 [Phascolomyces articulosus]|uniref:Smr domain-containing protein n=1 Tax=Phascolomyces articulosus TaxID=60185 RepID=A0AAD5PJZ3_9FUNG|nr:hypothetical protein BDA99DRAFT_130523 [Phascolomyces articulosus]
MWRKKLLTPPSPETLPRITSGNERNERRYTSLRSHAIKWGKKMNEETERASKAKQEGRLEDAESHEKRAYEYSGRMRRENAKASQAIFNECNNPKNRNRFIDLHGQHIAEAKQHIKRWFDDFQTQRDVVYIVTGAGRHSRNKNNNTTTKKGQLKEAIQDYLKRLYQYNETNVYGDDMGGVFAVLFCIHEYPSKHSRKCHKCEYVKQTE